MRTLLRFCGRNTKTATGRSTMYERKRRMARNPTRRDGSEAGFPVVLFFPKGALTHHLRTAQHFRRWWYPSRWSGRALSEGDTGAFRSLRRTTDDAGKAPLVRAAVGAIPDSASKNYPGCCGTLRRPTPALAKSATAQGTPFGCGRFYKSTG